MKKSGNILAIVLLAFFLSCDGESSVILGKWKLNDEYSNNGKMVLTFFSKNIYTIAYSANNKMNSQIMNNGIWNFDEESNIIKLINNKGNTIETFQIELLNKDSLIWHAINDHNLNSNESKLFIREE